MRSGAMRFLVSIQDTAPMQNDYGESIPGWQTIWSNVHADVFDLSGVEVWRVQHVDAEATVQVEMRYFPNIKPRQRVIFGSRTLEIVSASNPDGRKRKMVLNCKEAV